MKHCPNSECPGLDNFKTVSEFNDTALSCSDCGGALVVGPAPSLEEMRNKSRPEPEPDLELVPVFIVKDEAELLLVESVLHQASIPYLAKGEQIQDLFGFGRLTAVNPITGPVEIYVAMDKSEDARNILAETLEEDSGQ
jgi:hypothetical protein